MTYDLVCYYTSFYLIRVYQDINRGFILKHFLKLKFIVEIMFFKRINQTLKILKLTYYIPCFSNMLIEL